MITTDDGADIAVLAAKSKKLAKTSNQSQFVQLNLNTPLTLVN